MYLDCQNCANTLRTTFEKEHGFCEHCDARPAAPKPPFVPYFYLTQSTEEPRFHSLTAFIEVPRVFKVTVGITPKNKHAHIEVTSLCGEGVEPLKFSNQLANAAITETLRKLSNAGIEITSVGVEIK